MIQIDKIESLDGTSTKLEEISSAYLDAVNSTKYNAIPPLTRLQNSLARFTNAVELDILNYCIANYNNIVIGKPFELAIHVNYFDTQLWTDYLTNKTNVHFRNELLEIFGYENRFRLVKSKGIWFADKLNIKACPYCNAQFTIITRKALKPKKAKFQFDHFYSKSSYPQLSVSMYNLVPSCAACNVSKNNKPLNLTAHYHPFASSLSDKMNFKLDNESVLAKLKIGKVRSSSIKIKVEASSPTYSQFVKDHCKLYDIEDVYASHADFAEEILLKALMYPPSKRRELLRVSGLFKDKATFQRYLIGNYPDEKDILKRPLAKFTQDIARQLKLI